MAVKPKSSLLFFYGTECVHCHKMEPLVDRLEEDIGAKFDRLETWHNEENAAYLESLDKGFCGGVPFFYNLKSGKWICGETDYESLKKWAQGK
jgi:thiol-disulfide isomerase/thioredoxin